MSCPLCDSKEIVELERVNKDDLTDLYSKLTGVDFKYLICEDLGYCECRNCKLRFFDPAITGDERFYKSLQKFDWYYADNKHEYSIAKKFIEETDRVLEVGSGKGAFANHISSKTYVGLDFSENAKKLAEANGVLIENETIENHSSKHPGCYDVVVSFQVLEHVSNPREFIEAKLNSIKGGGVRLLLRPQAKTHFLNM